MTTTPTTVLMRATRHGIGNTTNALSLAAAIARRGHDVAVYVDGDDVDTVARYVGGTITTMRFGGWSLPDVVDINHDGFGGTVTFRDRAHEPHDRHAAHEDNVRVRIVDCWPMTYGIGGTPWASTIEDDITVLTYTTRGVDEARVWRVGYVDYGIERVVYGGTFDARHALSLDDTDRGNGPVWRVFEDVTTAWVADNGRLLTHTGNNNLLDVPYAMSRLADAVLTEGKRTS